MDVRHRPLVVIVAIVAIVALPPLLAACGDDPVPCDEDRFPEDPGATGALVHVAADCSGTGADGSETYPYRTISSALAHASAGDTLLVAPGVYEENVVVAEDGIRVVGFGAELPDGIIIHEPDPAASAGIIIHAPGPEDAGIIIHAPNPDAAAVMVDGAEGVWLQGLRIEEPGTAGIWVHAGSATIVASAVTGARADAEGRYGFGVLATETAGIIIHSTAITGSASSGLLVQSPKGEVAIVHNLFESNARGGARFEDVPGGAVVAANEVVANAELGLGAFSGAGIIIHRNAVAGTVAGGPFGGADGIVLAELAMPGGGSLGSLEVELGSPDAKADDPAPIGNQVSGSARAGVLVSGDVRGIIIHNEVDDSGRAGIWLQRGAGAVEDLLVEANSLSKNAFLGIALAAGTRAALSGNTVTETVEGFYLPPDANGLSSITLGDGIGLFAGASALIEGNTLMKNAHAGVFGDELAGAGTSLADNVFVQNGASGTADLLLQNVGDADEGIPAATDVDPTFTSGVAVLPESKDPDGFGTGADALDAAP